MSAFDRRVDPEIREVRRLEVITGALGRRRWSAEAKVRVVAESLAPGVVISEVARRHDLRPQQLFACRHQARQGRLALPAEDLSSVPVVRTTAEAPPADTAVAPVIEVALGGAIVRVPPEVDGRLLAKVLRAVKSVASSCRAGGSRCSSRPGRSTSAKGWTAWRPWCRSELANMTGCRM